MSNVFASAIFCVRNKEKAQQGDISRLPVAIGQANNVLNSIHTVDNAIGRTTKTAMEAYQLAAKNEKLLEYAGKGVNFLSKNVNSIILVSAGLNVATAEDKPKALVEQGSAIGAMFAGEALMKKYMDKGFSKAAKKASEIKSLEKVVGKAKAITATKWGATIPAIIKGVAFVIGSCTAYNVGEKFGKKITDKMPPSGKKEEIKA